MIIIKKWYVIMWAGLLVATPTTEAKLTKTVKFFMKELVKAQRGNQKKEDPVWKEQRDKIQKETCHLFKKLIIEKKIRYEDLEIIQHILDERLPKGHKLKKHPHNLTNEIGHKLIDDHLTIQDYEIIQEQLNRIFNSRPYRPWWEIVFRTAGEYQRRQTVNPLMPKVVIAP